MNLDHYETEDLNLAAYLIASGGCKLDGIENLDGWKVSFILYPYPTEELRASFFNGTGTVYGLELCNQIRSLKAAIKATKRSKVEKVQR